MRKLKITAILALALSALLLFSACGGAAIPVKKILLPDQTYVNENPSLTEITAIADLKDATYVSQSNELYYFTSNAESGVNIYKKHIVYNVKTNTTVLTLTENATKSISVSLDTLYLYYGDEDAKAPYITVTTTSWKVDASELKVGLDSYTVDLYNADGSSIATANRQTTAVELADLLYFDGRCYRLGENGTFAYAFDYSALAQIPNVSEKYGDYYYEFGYTQINVYDEALKFVSSYSLPQYAEPTSATVLEDGNILIQYIYKMADDASDYVFISEDEINIDFGENLSVTVEALCKYGLVTELITAKNGSAKKLDCNYLINYADNLADEAESYAKDGIDTKKVPVLATAELIENQRLVDNRLLIIKKGGKITEVDAINGELVEEFYLVANNRWEVECEDRTYLINEKGEILGDVSNAQYFGNYLYFDGKVYNYDLAVAYDFAGAGLRLYSSMDNALILQNTDGEYLLYTGGEAATTIISKTAKLSLDTVQSNFYVLRNEEAPEDVKYDIYNDQGTKLLTINDEDYNVFSEIGYGSYYDLPQLFSCLDQNTNRIYYRLH